MKKSKYTIPRKKRLLSEDCQQEITLDSREGKDLISSITKSTWEAGELDRNFIITKIVKVDNPTLEREFQDKRAEMRDQGYSPKELTESLAFKIELTTARCKEYSKSGLCCPGDNDLLGDRKMGVSLWRCPDLCLKCFTSWPSSWTLFLMVCRIVKGKVKCVTSKKGAEAQTMEPTPNYDCHVSKDFPNHSITNVTTLLKMTQYYVYEYNSEGFTVERPRQCLPYAIVHIQKLIPSLTPEIKQLFPVSEQSSIEESRPLVPQESTTIKQQPLDDSSSQLAWRGLIATNNHSLGVVAVHAGHKIGLKIWKSFLDVKSKIALNNLLKVIPGDIITAWSQPLEYRNSAFSLCTLKPCGPSDNYVNFIKTLALKDHAAAVVNVSSSTILFLVPSCKLAVELGFCAQSEPWRMFCIVRRRRQALNINAKPTPNAEFTKTCSFAVENLDIDTKIEIPYPVKHANVLIGCKSTTSVATTQKTDPERCTQTLLSSERVNDIAKPVVLSNMDSSGTSSSIDSVQISECIGDIRDSAVTSSVDISSGCSSESTFSTVSQLKQTMKSLATVSSSSHEQSSCNLTTSFAKSSLSCNSSVNDSSVTSTGESSPPSSVDKANVEGSCLQTASGMSTEKSSGPLSSLFDTMNRSTSIPFLEETRSDDLIQTRNQEKPRGNFASTLASRSPGKIPPPHEVRDQDIRSSSAYENHRRMLVPCTKKDVFNKAPCTKNDGFNTAQNTHKAFIDSEETVEEDRENSTHGKWTTPHDCTRKHDLEAKPVRSKGNPGSEIQTYSFLKRRPSLSDRVKEIKRLCRLGDFDEEGSNDTLQDVTKSWSSSLVSTAVDVSSNLSIPWSNGLQVVEAMLIELEFVKIEEEIDKYDVDSALEFLDVDCVSEAQECREMSLFEGSPEFSNTSTVGTTLDVIESSWCDSMKCEATFSHDARVAGDSHSYKNGTLYHVNLPSTSSGVQSVEIPVGIKDSFQHTNSLKNVTTSTLSEYLTDGDILRGENALQVQCTIVEGEGSNRCLDSKRTMQEALSVPKTFCPDEENLFCHGKTSQNVSAVNCLENPHTLSVNATKLTTGDMSTAKQLLFERAISQGNTFHKVNDLTTVNSSSVDSGNIPVVAKRCSVERLNLQVANGDTKQSKNSTATLQSTKRDIDMAEISTINTDSQIHNDDDVRQAVIFSTAVNATIQLRANNVISSICKVNGNRADLHLPVNSAFGEKDTLGSETSGKGNLHKIRSETTQKGSKRPPLLPYPSTMATVSYSFKGASHHIYHPPPVKMRRLIDDNPRPYLHRMRNYPPRHITRPPFPIGYRPGLAGHFPSSFRPWLRRPLLPCYRCYGDGDHRL